MQEPRYEDTTRVMNCNGFKLDANRYKPNSPVGSGASLTIQESGWQEKVQARIKEKEARRKEEEENKP